MKFVIASHNWDKIKELQQLLAVRNNNGIPYTDLLAKQNFPSEGEKSYVDNASEKAMFISRLLPRSLVIADDSGIHLSAYPEILGVRTARDLSAYPTPHDYDQYLINLVRNKNREFKMKTVLTCAYEGKVIGVVDGVLQGKLAEKERGTNGEGFNRILIPQETTKTLAEMPFREQYKYLSRARAAENLNTLLKENNDQS